MGEGGGLGEGRRAKHIYTTHIYTHTVFYNKNTNKIIIVKRGLNNKREGRKRRDDGKTKTCFFLSFQRCVCNNIFCMSCVLYVLRFEGENRKTTPTRNPVAALLRRAGVDSQSSRP